MSVITTTLTTDFSNVAANGDLPGLLRAEWDTRPDGYNGGKSQFKPGDSPVYLEFASSNVEVNTRVKTAGALKTLGTGALTVGGSDDPEFITFDAANPEVTLTYPVSAGFSYTWHGQSLGTPQLVDYGTKIRVAIDPADQTALGVLEISYTSAFRAVRLTNVPLTVRRVAIKLIGTRS